MTADAPEIRRFLDGRVILHAGDCLDVLDGMDENSVDVVITDPPYHYDTIVERFGKPGAAPAQHGTDGAFKRAAAGFMGKDWDGGDIAFRPETWARVLRVLKPGGHMAAFSAPKCVHKMAFGIEAAGFEVRDRIIHLFDLDEHVTAFLESLTKGQAEALFRMADHFGPLGEAFWIFGSGFPKSHNISKAIDRAANPAVFEPSATPEGKIWQGWGTALKPAYEPIVIARKPIVEKSIAAQVLATGTGAINTGAARIEALEGVPVFNNGIDRERERTSYDTGGSNRTGEVSIVGRFPANLTHDGSAAATVDMPEAPGAQRPTGPEFKRKAEIYGTFRSVPPSTPIGDSGSAARYFYTAKADAHDRIGSGHPTVKPLDLMQWLCRMLTPPGGTVLDLFAGTGTTGEAAFREGFNAILIEREAEYQADIARRMENATAGPVTRRHAADKAKAARRAKSSEPQSPHPDADVDDMFAEA